MHVNKLIEEKSPYLLQHAHNPVDWLPWGEEAFAKARAEDKPIFLSVGYSTCHWCHVMERESFESEPIAEVLNRHFVPVKVDREERPDVDRIYMMFVQATTGGGGWPMSVWLTPDLKPFYGGTYFPPDSRYGRPGFGFILEQLAQAWQLQREKLLSSGEAVVSELSRAAEVRSGAEILNPDALDATFHYLRRTFDGKFGGFGSAPKFPRPSVLNFLLRYSVHAKNSEAREMVETTLREMARGGMHDQLGGGFHRYSVDERWFVPHFEKMLYDQAQLAVSYLEAYQNSGEGEFARVAVDILDYVLRDMTHPDGGFYSAEDADSAADADMPRQKSEGAFYIWSQQELVELLGAQRASWFTCRYGCADNGNVDHDPHGEFTGKNILFEARTVEATARRFDLEPAEMEKALDAMRRELLLARSRRPRPHLDDKVLTAWNGLMISAFTKAAQVFEFTDAARAAHYRDAALRAAAFVFTHLYDARSETLYRRWRESERAVEGFLDDYAFFTQGLIDLYETTFDAGHLEAALRLTARMLDLFEDKEHGGFYSTVARGDLVLRLKEDYDGAEPAGNSVAVMNLLRLAQYTGNEDLRETALDTLRAFASRLLEQGPTIPQMLCAWLDELSPKRQIVIAGALAHPDSQALLAQVRRRYLPARAVFTLAGDEERMRLARWIPALAGMREVDGRPAAYVCENFACQLPVTGPAQLAELLD